RSSPLIQTARSARSGPHNRASSRLPTATAPRPTSRTFAWYRRWSITFRTRLPLLSQAPRHAQESRHADRVRYLATTYHVQRLGEGKLFQLDILRFVEVRGSFRQLFRHEYDADFVGDRVAGVQSHHLGPFRGTQAGLFP